MKCLMFVSNTSSNIIDKIRKLQTKMAAKEVAMVVILSELADSDDEKPTRGPTRSWIKRRKENGFFETIIRELILEDLAGFKEMFRMGYADFEKILSSIVVLISPQEIIGGHRPICAEEKLALTLRFLSTGEPFSSLSFQFRISKRAVAYIVKRVCESIVKCLLHTYMSLPGTEDEWLQVAQKFEQRWNYPHVSGAIDGKHVVTQKPKNGGSYYYTYKHTHSIILMAIVGPNYECIYADVGTNGRVNDSGVWNKSLFLKGIEDGRIHLPSEDLLYNSNI